MNLGERVKNKRIDLGMKQTELAQKIGISSGAMSGIESGKKDVSRETIAKISKALEISTDYIIFGKEEAEKISTEENEFLKLINTDISIKEALESILNAKKKVVNDFNKIAHG